MSKTSLDCLCIGETITKDNLENMLTAGPEQAKLAMRYKDMKLEKAHISWDTNAIELTPEERAAVLNKMLDSVREDEANIVPIKVSELREIYKALKQLTRMGQIDIREWTNENKEICLLRREVGSLAEFPAIFAGQALPKEIREKVKKELEEEYLK